MNELRNLCVRTRIRKGLGFRSLLIVSLFNFVFFQQAVPTDSNFVTASFARHNELEISMMRLRLQSKDVAWSHHQALPDFACR